MKSYLIKNALIVNEGKIYSSDLLLKNQRIEKIDNNISDSSAEVIEANGSFLLPGMIDDQVHFREPGLTHKADLFSESRAAVAGGVTSFMEMPNTIPNTLTQKLLQDKYDLAAKKSVANYSFYMGVSHDNLEEILQTDKDNVCGIKVFMGSSTGNMLVDRIEVLEKLFSRSELLIATHCEDENTIKKNIANALKEYGENVPMKMHPFIRSEEACYLSSSFAIRLAKKHGTRLHILHISTAKELELFDNTIPLLQKKITAEACIHHLYFNDSDYEKLGSRIKWNPAIKTKRDQEAILKAVIDNRIDVIATDHAPHTWEEKSESYFKTPSGGPLVQFVFLALMELFQSGKISLEDIVRKTSHSVAECFQVKDRGFIREGYFGDIALIDLTKKTTVQKEIILSKCKWSPFEGYTFQSSITKTFVNGHLVYNNGLIDDSQLGHRLTFKRN